MATPRSSRGSSIDHTFTPESHPRTATSMSIPKSECLRNALEARRAQKTPVQSLPKLVLADTPVLPAPRSAAPSPLSIQTPTTPDEFDQFELPEDIMAPESPIRRRRHHDNIDMLPRGKTNQELSAEVEKLREELIKQNIRVELLNKSNHDLQAKWVSAKEEVDQLKPLEEENYDLRTDNKRLTDKLAGVQHDIDHIDEMHDQLDELYAGLKAAEEANDALKIEVTNLTGLHKEAVTTVQKTEEGLQEGVNIMIVLEQENEGLKIESFRLKKEVEDLRTRVAAIESQQVDGCNYPQRIHSIDENAPATSHDDSDYYSQPATPRADKDRDAHSIRTLNSARSKQFVEMTKERTRSARSLSKRLSDASLRAASVVSAIQRPAVPDIPEVYSPVTPRIVDARFRERRYRREADVQQFVARSDVEIRRPATVTPVQTRQFSGRRPSIPTQSAEEIVLPAPPRMSSRRAHTTSGDGVLLQSSDGTVERHAFGGPDKPKQEQVPSTRTSAHPRTSTVSKLTSPRIDIDQDRWWKDTQKVRPLQARATQRQLSAGFASAQGASGSATFAARMGSVSVSSSPGPSTPVTEKPEPDFLFNPKESEEQFAKKVFSKLRGSIRRRHDASE
jgi:predicted  nucleic acid-binding Zn-ribbon protein